MRRNRNIGRENERRNPDQRDEENRNAEGPFYQPLLCIKEQLSAPIPSHPSAQPCLSKLYKLSPSASPNSSSLNYSSLLQVNNFTQTGRHQQDINQLFCITMYNEPYIQILQSLAGIYRNYFELLEINKEHEGSIAVVIVCDGYPIFDNIGKGSKGNEEEKTNAKRYEEAGIYDPSTTKKFRNRESYSDLPALEDIDGVPENFKHFSLETNNLAHCYSKSMKFEEFLNGLTHSEIESFRIDNLPIKDFLYGNYKDKSSKDWKYESMPMDIHFVIKHHNRGKIESHLWFFKGFCNLLKPELATIIDAGTIPMWKSLSKMAIFMEINKNTGGLCGEIEVMLNPKHSDGSDVSFFESILLRSQYIEYKLSHYLDKAGESLFGYISVLPGAFSMFRWKCLEGEPLEEFLKGTCISDPSKPSPSCSEANKFLAEDRILPLEIISKKSEEYIIRYIPGCKALTDAPHRLITLLKQRRRWFNGSLFATLYVLRNPCKILKRKGCCHTFFYWIYFLFMALNTFTSLLIVGIYYAAYSIFLRSILDDSRCFDLSKTANLLENIYLVFIGIAIIFSSGVRIEWCERFFIMLVIFMGIFSLMMLVAVLISVVNLKLTHMVYISIGGLVSTYVLPMIFNISKIKIVEFIKGTAYLFFMIPTYINIMTIYAISNIHDVTWGSRASGLSDREESRRQFAQRIEYETYRSNWIIIWLTCNIAAGFYINIFARRDKYGILLFIVVCFLGGIILIKIILASLYFLRFRLKKSAMKKWIKSKIDDNSQYPFKPISSTHKTHSQINEDHLFSSPLISSTRPNPDDLVPSSDEEDLYSESRLQSERSPERTPSESSFLSLNKRTNSESSRTNYRYLRHSERGREDFKDNLRNENSEEINLEKISISVNGIRELTEENDTVRMDIEVEEDRRTRRENGISDDTFGNREEDSKEERKSACHYRDFEDESKLSPTKSLNWRDGTSFQSSNRLVGSHSILFYHDKSRNEKSESNHYRRSYVSQSSSLSLSP